MVPTNSQPLKYYNNLHGVERLCWLSPWSHNQHGKKSPELMSTEYLSDVGEVQSQ